MRLVNTTVDKLTPAPLLATIILLIGVGVMPACSKAQTPEALIHDARQYQEKGDAKAALIQLKNALKQAPDNREARYLIGVITLEAGDPAAAEKDLRKALELRMDAALVLPALGRALLLQGQFQKVLDEITQPAKATPAVAAQIIAIRGQALLGLGQTKQAKDAFDHALRLQPGFDDALLGEALLAGVENNTGLGLQLVDQVLTKSPGNIRGWMMKGDLLRLVTRNDDAIAAYQKAIDINPNHVGARVNMTSIQISAGNYEKAREGIAILGKLMPLSPMLDYMQALIEYRQNHYPEALAAVQQVLKVASGYLPAVLLAGALELALGSYSLAEQHLSDVLAKTPGDLNARKLMVSSLIKSNQVPRAVEVLQPGLQQAPEDSTLLALAGEVYLRNNDFARATELFEKAAALNPRSAGTFTGLGLSRMATGQTELAMTDLGLAVGLDPVSYQADILLTMSHLGRKEFDKALLALQSLEKKQPKNPLTFNLKAAIYSAQNDLVNARKSLEQAIVLEPTYFPAIQNLAKLDVEEKKPEQARQRFESLLKKDKNNMLAMLALAELAASDKADDKVVIDWLERAKNSHPEAVEPPLTLAKYHLLKTRDIKKALAAAREAETADPNNADMLDTLGLAQLAAEEKDQSLSTYRKLAKLQPKSPLALLRLATAEITMQKPDDAAATLKKALVLKPDYLDAQISLAALDLRSGRNEDALKIAQQIQAQSPEGSNGYVLEGDVWVAGKEYAKAVTAYQKAYDLNKSGPLAIKLHALQEQAGNTAAGDTLIQEWLTANPDDANTRLYLAQAQLQKENFPLAIEQYEQALKKQPDNAVILNNLAYAYQQVNDPRAIATAEQALKLQPENAAIMDTVGWMLFEQGQLPRALELLQKAVSLAPDAQEIRYHLAQGWAKSGDRAKARKELEQIKAKGTTFAQQAEALNMLEQLQN